MPRIAYALIALLLVVPDASAQEDASHVRPGQVVASDATTFPSKDDAHAAYPALRYRFVTHFLNGDVLSRGEDGDAGRALWYAGPRPGGILDNELQDVLEVEASLRTWTSYRDEVVHVEMRPFSPGWRIVLPFNRPVETSR